MINYRILLKSLKISTKEYKGTLRNRRNNRNMRNKAYKILKNNKDFGITVNTKISILK